MLFSRDMTLNKYFILTFIVSCMLLSTLVYVVYKQSKVMEHQNTSIVHSYEVLRKVRRVLTYALDMETAQRGYLLTGTKSYLSPYYASLAAVEKEINSLKASVTDNPDQQQNVAELNNGLNKLKDVLKYQIRRFQRSGILGLTLKDMQQSRSAMGILRSRTDEIINTEIGILNSRSATYSDERRNYFIILFVGTALAISGLLVANIIIVALMAKGRRAQEKLQEFQELYQIILEGLNDGMYEYIPATGRLLLSPSHQQLLGYAPSELPSDLEGFKKMIHPDDFDHAIKIVEQYFRREIPNYSSEFRVRHKNGIYLWILSRGVAQWDNRGKVRRLVGTHTNITTQKEREEELRDVNIELERFTYITSHDLRAPLINLKGFADEIQYSLNEASPFIQKSIQTLPPKEQKSVQEIWEKDIPEALNFIYSAVGKMEALTGAILDLSHIGSRVMRQQKVESHALMQRSIDTLTYEIQQKGAQVECAPLPEMETDPVALEQIFGNLLDNAVKYLDPARPGRISISAQELPNEIQFSIRDNGRGIAYADRHKVFDIFRRAANSGDVRGLGMGMAYVRTIVRRLGGRIWFESTLGEGTTFHFTLPRVIPEQIKEVA